MPGKYVIAGLGNPGKKYDRTRHNIGFAAVDLLAKKFGVEFRSSDKVDGELAQADVAGEKCLLLKPQTFMNLSGQSVSKTMRYFEVDLSRVLVIVDDVDLPLGQMRLRIESGPGTHNGLKSVEESLGTNRYARLRLGVGDRSEGDLASYVLGKFSDEEQKLVEALLERAAEAVELFIKNGLTRAMDFANRKV